MTGASFRCRHANRLIALVLFALLVGAPSLAPAQVAPGITCYYGPINVQADTGFVPFMNLGRVAVAACPSSKALASAINATRFN